MKKNSAFCSVTTYNPAVASFTEQLYEQMTSNPSFKKRNIQNANAYLLNILVRSETLCHVSHSTELITAPHMSNMHKRIRFVKPMVRLVPIENDVIPMVLLVNMHPIKGPSIIFSHAMCILRSISHLCKTSSLLHQVKTR